MIERAPEIDSADFSEAARLDRLRRRERRSAARSAALADLHRFRDAFCDHAEPAAADRDADRLERLADRLVDWSGELKRHCDGLELACDQAAHQGGLLVRRRIPIEAEALAEALAERLCEEVLSAHAGAVLRAAVRLATI